MTLLRFAGRRCATVARFALAAAFVAATAALPSCARAQTKAAKHGKKAANAAPLAGLPSPSERALKVCVAADAPAEVRAAAQAILAASGPASTHPLLRTFAGTQPPPTALTDSAALLAAKPEVRAYNQLVIVGLTTDPLIKAVWQRDARVTAPGTLYDFGFGYLSGDIGYIESDRNPFLHGIAIKVAPFETEIVTITGTTPAGVALAAQAFLNEGLINGVVAAPGWTRPKPNLLSRDPLAPGFALPAFLPAAVGDLPRIGITQAAEDEYRGVLADTDSEPLEIWRAKYHRPDAWDAAGNDAAMSEYTAGLHRRSYGDTLWCARFSTPALAAAAAPKIAHRADLRAASGGVWHGSQPDFIGGSAENLSLTLWQHGDWVLMSTLPATATADLQRAVEAER